MKFTEEIKNRIDSYFDNISPEEFLEVAKRYGYNPNEVQDEEGLVLPEIGQQQNDLKAWNLPRDNYSEGKVSFIKKKEYELLKDTQTFSSAAISDTKPLAA